MEKNILEYQIFKPHRSANAAHIWNSFIIIAGLFSLFFLRKNVFSIIFGISFCLLGLWMFFGSRRVLRTHFLITQDEIVSGGPHLSLGMKWDEIGTVQIRERPRGIQLNRADRLIILIGITGRKIPLNTSVLSTDDENSLVEIILSKVTCPVKKITDGSIFPSQKNKF